jgi:transcriptional regulator of nitric oxide reductase
MSRVFTCRVLWRVLLALQVMLMSLLCQVATAGSLDKAAITRLFPSPLMVGDRDAALPVWPLFKNDLTSSVLVGYVFESIDLAPVPGFSGTPINLLIALDAKGSFMAVKVLSHHEPVFLEGLGDAALVRFVDQYQALSLQQHIRIGPGGERGRGSDHGNTPGGANVQIDGVSKATASVRIVNQSLLSAALVVARAKLGFAAGRSPDQLGHIKAELFQTLDFEALRRAGLVSVKRWNQRDIEAAFKGTPGEGLDALALREPEALFSEMLVAHLNVPSVGRNLLTPRAWRYLSDWLAPGDHAFLVATRGRYSFAGDNYVTGGVPELLTLEQGGLAMEIRDMDVDGRPRLPDDWLGADARWHIVKVISQASLDPAAPLDFALGVVRRKGQILAEKVRKDFALRVQLPAAWVEPARGNEKNWHSIWTDRAGELVLLLTSLAGLAVLLSKPGWITRDAKRLERIRLGWGLYTLVFIGWLAQGQLSIVNLTALIHALLAGRSLDFFLYDPMTVLLWAFVAVSLVIWGRGTFCGWLCPFGALQEWIAQAARWARLPQLRLHSRNDARLKRIKYGVLALVVVMPVFSSVWTDRLVEIEPFKTSITLMFVRAWPFVAWVLALLVLNAFVYKAYCRYLCPLGAGLAVLGRLRQWAWLARRSECGQPCQTCRHRCGYQAIEKSGAIDYAECFQCLDCVAILESDQLCAPRILATRKGRVIPVFAVPATPLTEVPT